MNPSLPLTDAELLAYLDETLAVERAVLVERELRNNPALRNSLAQLAHGRDQGGYGLGEIWSRERLSCLSRQQLGDYLQRKTAPELTDYIQFHLNQIACRYCRANLADLEESQRQPGGEASQRRFFKSSAGALRAQRTN